MSDEESRRQASASGASSSAHSQRSPSLSRRENDREKEGDSSPFAHPSSLFVISTPIGNLEDITLRALRILREVDLIAAEDTRVTRKLLSHYDIHTPITSFHEHSRRAKAADLAERLAAGESIALVSDAGTPAISDPGAELIAAAIERGAPVVPIPGPSAALAALVASGLPTGRFAFEGFPPRAKSDRRAFLQGLRHEPRTLVLYESPMRLLQTLRELYDLLGDRPVAVVREVTKRFEEVHRGTLSSALLHFDASPPRGEFTLVIGGRPPAEAGEPARAQDITGALRTALESGATSRDAVEQVAAELGLPRRVVYRALIEYQRSASARLAGGSRDRGE